MESFPVILTILVGVLVASTGAKKVVSGELTVSGITCKYFEYRQSGLNRGLRLCSCKNNQKKPIGKSCLYSGANPHNCNYYNGHQETYYRLLAQSAMENGAPCAKSEITENKCNLVYPCIEGSCLTGRRRRDVGSGECPAFDLGSSKSSTLVGGLIGIFIPIMGTIHSVLLV